MEHIPKSLVKNFINFITSFFRKNMQFLHGISITDNFDPLQLPHLFKIPLLIKLH